MVIFLEIENHCVGEKEIVTLFEVKGIVSLLVSEI